MVQFSEIDTRWDDRQAIVMEWFARWALIVTGVSAVVFTAFPSIDMTIAQVFYLGDRRFSAHESFLVPYIRNAFMASYVAACILALAGLYITARYAGLWLQLYFSQWLFVVLCLAVGPGLVANVIFKDNWGRARPKQVIEFGGSQPFTPALQPAANCEKNCSFVSGEASSMFVLLFTGAALYRRHPRALIKAGVVIGGLAGLMRMAQGSHFLSDVIFAGALMALTVCCLFFLFNANAFSKLTMRRRAVLDESFA